jgi:hypothetical protein
MSTNLEKGIEVMTEDLAKLRKELDNEYLIIFRGMGSGESTISVISAEGKDKAFEEVSKRDFIQRWMEDDNEEIEELDKKFKSTLDFSKHLHEIGELKVESISELKSTGKQIYCSSQYI